MKKGYYYFGECTGLEKALVLCSMISFVISAGFLIKGGYLSLLSSIYSFNTDNAWCLFFLLLGLFLLVTDICINKLCRDVAVLLKQMEDKRV